MHWLCMWYQNWMFVPIWPMHMSIIPGERILRSRIHRSIIPGERGGFHYYELFLGMLISGAVAGVVYWRCTFTRFRSLSRTQKGEAIQVPSGSKTEPGHRHTVAAGRIGCQFLACGLYFHDCTASRRHCGTWIQKR